VCVRKLNNIAIRIDCGYPIYSSLTKVITGAFNRASLSCGLFF
jgi:hypothetical protein